MGRRFNYVLILSQPQAKPSQAKSSLGWGNIGTFLSKLSLWFHYNDIEQAISFLEARASLVVTIPVGGSHRVRSRHIVYSTHHDTNICRACIDIETGIRQDSLG